MQVERLSRVNLLSVGDELDRLVDQVLAEVVALLRRAWRLHLVVVIHQIRVPLAGVAAQEPVEALEAAPQRPPVIRACAGFLVARRQVVLPDHERAVPMIDQHLGQEAILKRNDPVVSGVAARQLRDARHRVAVMIAACQNARPARRTQRRRVHVAIAQPVRRQSVEAGRLDRAAVTAQLAESRIVQDDEQHIRGARPRPHRRRPGRRGLISGPPDHARERNAGPILNNWHADHPRCSPAALVAHILRRQARARITRHGWCGSHRAGTSSGQCTRSSTLGCNQRPERQSRLPSMTP